MAYIFSHQPQEYQVNFPYYSHPMPIHKPLKDSQKPMLEQTKSLSCLAYLINKLLTVAYLMHSNLKQLMKFNLWYSDSLCRTLVKRSVWAATQLVTDTQRCQPKVCRYASPPSVSSCMEAEDSSLWQGTSSEYSKPMACSSAMEWFDDSNE
jgi:hypothetical protein